MTNEELNTALYKKMFAEQDEFRSWLLEHTESPHMEHVWDCVEQCAKDTLEAQQMTGLPIYPHSAAYAREHDELPVYRASYQANVDCSKAIDAAIREHYSDNRLNSAAVKQVVDRFGFDRTLMVLAATARYKDRDPRISDDNKKWASTIFVPDDKDVRGVDRTIAYVVGYAHPGLVNLFMREARRQAQQPSIHQQLQQKPDTPAKKSSIRKEPIR